MGYVEIIRNLTPTPELIRICENLREPARYGFGVLPIFRPIPCGFGHGDDIGMRRRLRWRKALKTVGALLRRFGETFKAIFRSLFSQSVPKVA